MRVGLAGIAVAMVSAYGTGYAKAQCTERVSLSSEGDQGNQESGFPSISSDGRFVAFASSATNLVPGDINKEVDVFVRDRQTGITTLVSVQSNGSQGNGGSLNPSISEDGRFVAFISYATNLVQGDTNHFIDVFVHDRQTATTTRVSVDSAGHQVTYHSLEPSISADGRFVVFSSESPDLVPGDTNRASDVFVHDRQTSATTRVSRASNGAQGNSASFGPSISADGRFVAFASNASDLVSGDTNNQTDVFLHDRSTGTTTRVTIDFAGGQANGPSTNAAISADGRVLTFESEAADLVPGDSNATFDVFVHDLQARTTSRVSADSTGQQANDSSRFASISADGRFVAFWSVATNLVNGDNNHCSDVFVRDRQTGTTDRITVDSSGAEGDRQSWIPSMSANGRWVAFDSFATNLVSDDINSVPDTFVYGTEEAGWANYGTGFSGTFGVPSFTSQNDPVLGTTLSLDLGNSWGNDTAALLFVGYQASSSPTNLGGTLLVIPVLTMPMQVRWNGSTVHFGIPDDCRLSGIDVFLQVLEIDPGAAKGVSFTAGLELWLGD